MSVLESICEYCSHRSPGDAASCIQCGAPLAKLMSGDPLALIGPVIASADKLIGPTGSTVEGAVKAVFGGVGPRLPQWIGALVGVVAMAAAVFFLVNSCGPELSSGWNAPARTLPQTLLAASTCTGAGESQQCVVAAGNPLLAAGIGGGRELAYAARVVSPDQLANDVRQWRSAGATVVADGTTFIAISPSWNIWYADTQSGLRLETGSLPNAAAARAFLMRSGLLG
ncbi:hypothetical protein OHB26_23495 [Nocardia sp. NBC_01503]|uniref:hypothetical protein n=1 Tax=Nocardia sp. NBC_01503 TaxID=2975997 RepID=UPI002E7BAE82|nr:hypothetical protein [Nocardia sp. NBC_01503]WTL29923.1 hypothetical protein OHB26_23495 [Nocardia sp. NBC_01503]